MNSVDYNAICTKPSAFRVPELEDTLVILRRERAKEVSVVALALLNGRVEKPEKYTGNRMDEFCVFDCTFEEADAIVDILFEAEAGSVSATGETTAETSKLVDLVNKWSNFRETL